MNFGAGRRQIKFHTVGDAAATSAYDFGGNPLDSAIFPYAPATGSYGAPFAEDRTGQSVYYVLDSTGSSAFKEAQHRWRAQLSEPDRSWFGRMIGLRDDDVHLALTRGKALPKYIAEDWRTRSTSPYYQTQFYNAAIFGPAPVVEMKNPDGTLVKGSALQSAVGLYIERQGQLVEATDACREFIRQLATLLDAVKSTAE